MHKLISCQNTIKKIPNEIRKWDSGFEFIIRLTYSSFKGQGEYINLESFTRKAKTEKKYINKIKLYNYKYMLMKTLQSLKTKYL